MTILSWLPSNEAYNKTEKDFSGLQGGTLNSKMYFYSTAFQNVTFYTAAGLSKEFICSFW